MMYRLRINATTGYPLLKNILLEGKSFRILLAKFAHPSAQQIYRYAYILPSALKAVKFNADVAMLGA